MSTYISKKVSIWRGLSKEIGIIFASSLFLIVCSYLSVPFVPVSFTMQTFGVLLLGALLGRRRATLATVAYLFQLPLFLGIAATSLFSGALVGYYLGMIVAAYLSGWIYETTRSSGKRILGLIAANAIILGLGTLQLASFIGMKQALLMGCIIFVPGDLAKLMLAYSTAKRFKV